MHKLVETTGSPNQVVTVQVYSRQSVSVTSVSIKLNAPNGALTMSDSESGVDSPQREGKQYVKAET